MTCAVLSGTRGEFDAFAVRECFGTTKEVVGKQFMGVWYVGPNRYMRVESLGDLAAIEASRYAVVGKWFGNSKALRDAFEAKAKAAGIKIEAFD